MGSKMYLKRIFLSLGLVGALALPAYIYSAAPFRENLFKTPRNTPTGLPGEDAPSKRQRLVRLNPSWIVRSEEASWVGPHARHTIKLFDDTELTLVIDRTQFKEKGRFTIIGHVNGIKDSEVVLAFYRGALSGVFIIPGKGSFLIRPTLQGFHWVIEKDPKAPFECIVI